MNRSGICGCCEGIAAETPATIDNRPGLSSVAYRVGTWAEFKASMLDALSLVPELAALHTRSDDDFAIALLDAWAIVCDILTFYQERIANEGYLRTAAERLSIGELGKLIGYKLRPGVAASAALAFTLNQPLASQQSPVPQASGSPTRITLDTGTKVQSVPAPGQQPATFETIAPIEARAAWNAMSPLMTRAPDRGAGNSTANVRLKGLLGDLQVGDPLLVIARDAVGPVLQRIKAIELDNASQTTLVHFDQDTPPTVEAFPTVAGSIDPLQVTLDDDLIWSSIRDKLWQEQGDLVAAAAKQGWLLDALEGGINALRGVLSPYMDPPVRVFTLKARASLFGHNAPDWNTIPASLRFNTSSQQVGSDGTPVVGKYNLVTAPYPYTWEGNRLYDDAVFANAVMSGQPTTFDLDNVYSALGAGDFLVLQSPDGSVVTVAAPILSTVQLTRTDYLLSAKVTRITLDANWQEVAEFVLRTTRVLGQTDELAVADVELDQPVDASGPTLLDGAYLSLKVGQLVMVSGERADKKGETMREVAAIKSLALVDGYTQVTFDPELGGSYLRKTVTLNANVAPSTHGETKSEILGSGDATVPFQRFALKQTPLTYVSAATPSGTASTLTVRVNGIAWNEVAWLYGHVPDERVYTVVVDEAGKTWVQFGDGTVGARVPSGRDNVQAAYRQGIGLAGMVQAGQLSMLVSRPLGLKDIGNPLASTGAGDPETIDDARANAPIRVRTLDRIVSLEDFEDFCRASAGIAKARVTWAWTGSRDVACVTVAGADGAAVVPGSPQYTNLLAAMLAAGDGTVPAALASYVAVTFSMAATISVDPSRDGPTVLAAVKAALRRAFSFDARDFMQPVFRSEVITVMQDVPGVVALTLDGFNYSAAAPGPQPDALIAQPPTPGPSGLVGAELLTLEIGTLPGVVLAP